MTSLTQTTAATAAATRAGERTRRRTPSRGSGSLWWRYLVVLLALVFALFPVVYLLSASLNPAGSLQTATLIPTSFSLNNFQTLFSDQSRPYGRVVQERLRHRRRRRLRADLHRRLRGLRVLADALHRPPRRAAHAAAAAALPALLTFTALYLTMAAVSDIVPGVGLNTVWGLILVYMGGAMGANVWLLKGYFDTVPRELDEAAKVDGASHARIFFTMTLRLVMPILVTTFMIGFVGLYSEFLLASIFLRDVDAQTLGVGLYSMTQGNEQSRLFGQFAAGSLLASLPVVALYLGAQKYLVGG